jgi:TatD DNase family protein
MLIDTHCHLANPEFTDVKKIIAEAREVGVEKILIPSGNLEYSKRSVLIAEQEGQYAMVGVHPEDVEDLHRFRVKPGMTSVVGQAVKELEGLANSSKRVIGIGEIGLDFNWRREKTPLRQDYAGQAKEKQIELFMAQMDLAVRLKLPVVIHMRDAEEEMWPILHKMEVLPRGQFHCFAGSEEFLKYILEKGFYVSFAGNITFKSATNLRSLVHQVPPDRLLLETDAPYLSPEPLRGRLNTPANVKIIATFIAGELALDTKNLIEQTGKNALCLYSLEN